jgi:hypothetical protein
LGTLTTNGRYHIFFHHLGLDQQDHRTFTSIHSLLSQFIPSLFHAAFPSKGSGTVQKRGTCFQRRFLHSPSTSQYKIHKNKMPPRLFQCCHCNNRPINIALNGSKCGSCDHMRCENCKTDSKIDPPSPKKATAMGDYAYHYPATYYHGPAVDLRVTRSIRESAAIPSATHHLTSALDKGHMRLRSHSMAGWWYCSNCNNMNNPALCGGRCTNCNHSKCPQCRAVSR